MKLPAPVFSCLLALALAIVTLAVSVGFAKAGASARDANALTQSSGIYVATVRKDGNQSTAVSVWFITTQAATRPSRTTSASCGGVTPSRTSTRPPR